MSRGISLLSEFDDNKIFLVDELGVVGDNLSSFKVGDNDFNNCF